MNRTRKALAALVALAISSPFAMADDDPGCSAKKLSGNWMFATSIGRQMFGEPFPPDQDVTAIGKMNIHRNGTISGSFDLTVEGFNFFPDILYDGSIVVNADCTGTITFVTSVGSMRTDSVAVLSRNEILGMSQDPANLWTYQLRRIIGRISDDRR